MLITIFMFNLIGSDGVELLGFRGSVALHTAVCLYIGPALSLKKYEVKKYKKDDKVEFQTENSLLSIKGVLTIPVTATLTLLIAFLAIATGVASAMVNHKPSARPEAPEFPYQ